MNDRDKFMDEINKRMEVWSSDIMAYQHVHERMTQDLGDLFALSMETVAVDFKMTNEQLRLVMTDEDENEKFLGDVVRQLHENIKKGWVPVGKPMMTFIHDGDGASFVAELPVWPVGA